MEKWGIRFGKMVPKIKPVDLIKSWRIVKGDLVQVIAGRYRGQQGKVLRVQRDRNSLIVEGINLVGKSLAELAGAEKGTIITMEQPIHLSNVSLIDPVQNIPTKIKTGWIEDKLTGAVRKARISKLSNSEIPKPEAPKRVRETGAFDTPPAVVAERTFFPRLDKSPIPDDCML